MLIYANWTDLTASSPQQFQKKALNVSFRAMLRCCVQAIQPAQGIVESLAHWCHPVGLATTADSELALKLHNWSLGVWEPF